MPGYHNSKQKHQKDYMLVTKHCQDAGKPHDGNTQNVVAI
jgi:hypothetical protein